MQFPLRGIVPPLSTPLASRDQLDEPGLDRLLEHVIAGGVHGIFALGTGGEATGLGIELRRRALEQICKTVAKRVPVLASVTDPSLLQTLALAQHAVDSGADAIVVSAPFYLPVDQDEMLRFFAAVAEASKLPVFLYNIPQLTHVTIDVETLRRAAEMENVVGFKDSSGDMDYFAAAAKVAPQRAEWTALIGNEKKLAEALQLGGHGAVGCGGNVWPQNLVAVYDAATSGDADKLEDAVAKQSELLEICKFGSTFPAIVRGVKCALDLLGICSPLPAEPIRPCDDDEREFIHRRLETLGLL